MSRITITPQKLNGGVQIPPSKSLSHRAIICAALAAGSSELRNVGRSADIDATVQAMEQLGASITREGDRLIIDGTRTLKNPISQPIDCNESGSTLRFLIPLALRCLGPVTFTGRGRLPQRPLTTYFDLFDRCGVGYQHGDDALPLTVQPGTLSGSIELEGNVSSQFVSGLLFLLPLMQTDSEIKMKTPLESRGYVDMTIEAMAAFGVTVHNHRYRTFRIKGGQAYRPANYTVEGDFSQAGFYLAAGAIGNFVVCRGLNLESSQGDKQMIDVIRKMGGTVICEKDGIAAVPSPLKGCKLNISQIPDLLPPIAVMAALAHGETVITGAQRLRYKESDRLTAVTEQLNSLGATVIEKADGLIIEGTGALTGGQVDSCNDHRIAMAAAIASTRCTQPVVVEGSDSVKKSYPHFWEDFQKLGGTFRPNDEQA